MIINLSRIDFGGVATGGGNAKPEEVFDVQPTTSDQTITPTEGSVFSGGTVRAVTSTIDSNIQPENIKEGVSILGVAGTLSGGSGGSANLIPLTVEASNENRTFNPSDSGADGFNSVNANGYDVDGLYNIFDDISNNDIEADPTVIAEWDAGTANITNPDYGTYAIKSPATTADVKFNQIDWAKNDEVTQITINNAENLISYSTMFASTPNLQSITADLGHKENIDMRSMFMGSGITDIMNLGLETCKPSNLMLFVQGTKIAQLPMMDTSRCTSFEEMLSESNIETLPAYSYAAMTDGAINWGNAPALTIVEGLVDLGLSFGKPGTVDISAAYYPALVKQSAWNIVNTVYDFVANNGAGNGSTINFSGFNWVWDEGEQANLITTANAKGWNIIF